MIFVWSIMLLLVLFLAEAYKEAGYDTAYIGKWHLDGHGRFCLYT